VEMPEGGQLEEHMIEVVGLQLRSPRSREMTWPVRASQWIPSHSQQSFPAFHYWKAATDSSVLVNECFSRSRANAWSGEGRPLHSNNPPHMLLFLSLDGFKLYAPNQLSTPGFLSPDAYYVIHRNPRNIVVARHNSRIS
jgi:hypothetical protein